MRQENSVQDVAVVDGGEVYSASYFVENGIVHANIAGRIIRIGIGSDQSEDNVRRLLLGHIQTKAWRRRLLEHWRK